MAARRNLYYNFRMRTLVEGFTKQLADAIRIGEGAFAAGSRHEVRNVIISGMGGSGIGGTIAAELVSAKSRVPVYANKSYFLPAYADKDTLVIISSYSGNTEESIQALESALQAGSRIVCIASGGKIRDLAREKKIDHITVPEGLPPRAAVGYSMVQIFFILRHFGVIDDYFLADFEAGIRLLDREEKNIEDEAGRVAAALFGKTPVIYAPIRSEGVAVRLRQDLNENAKVLAWHNIIPEMNHNEILGWSEKRDDLAVVFFRNASDYGRIEKRIEFTKNIVLGHAGRVVEVRSKGASMIEEALYHIHMSDWISVILSEMRKVNPDEIRTIENLKSALAAS